MWSFLMLTLISLGNADKLNRLYLPPPNANLAGGRPGDILAPKQTFSDKNEYGVPRTFQTTSGPKRILEDTYSSTTTPSYTDFSDSKSDQVLTKAMPKTDVITKNLRDGTVTQNLNRNNLFPNSVRGPDEEYSSIISFPDVQGSISPNKFVSSLPTNRGANIGDDSYPIPQTKFVNNNPFAEIKSENVNFAPVSTNIENMDRYVVPSSLNQRYPQGLTIDNVRSRFPGTLIANVNNRYPERAQAEADRQAYILNYENQVNPDSYLYSFDTSNGIHGDENGTILDGTRAQGSYSYIGDDGKLYNVTYTADENGFQPCGDHLPTPPPIPEAIQKALEKIAENERNGIFDDGSYDERKYGYKNFGKIGNKKPTFGEKQPFGRTSTSPIGKNNFLDTVTDNAPYRKPIITSTDSAQGDDAVIVEDKDDEYDDVKQVIEPVDFESNNNYSDDNTLLKLQQDIDTKTPSLKNQGINLPSFTYGQDSDDPSIQINTLPNAYPSTIRGNENIDVYSTNAPLTEAGYQYLIPTNRLITKSDTPSTFLDINNEGLVDVTPSTFRPFSNTKSPQTYTLNKNQGAITYPQAYNKLMSPIVLGDFVANQVNPQTGVFRNDDITNGYKPNGDKNNYQGKNDEIKDNSIYDRQNKKPYDSNSQDDTNIPENQQIGQKNFNPSSINNNAQFYSTTPMSSPFPLNPQAYNPKLINNPAGKIGLSTTSKPNTVTTPITKIGDENVYEVLPIVNTNISPEESTDEFGNTSELLKTPKITGGPVSSGIKDFEMNNGYNGSKNFYKIPNTEYRGEDFSGPKQPQRYDPVTGYHY